MYMPLSVASFALSNANVHRHYATEFGGQISEVNSTAFCQYCFWLKYLVVYNCHHQYCMRNGCYFTIEVFQLIGGSLMDAVEVIKLMYYIL